MTVSIQIYSICNSILEQHCLQYIAKVSIFLIVDHRSALTFYLIETNLLQAAINQLYPSLY